MLEFAIRIGKESGEYLREHFSDEFIIEHKGLRDPVTVIDRGSQTLIVEEIEHAFPDHSILAEEGVSKDKGSEFTWIIDPLDGTVNFVHGIPFFCVSIALYKAGKPYIGVCYNPMSNELFHAQAGQGAFLNRKSLQVSRTGHLIDALLVTGFPYVHDEMDTVMARFTRIAKEAQAVRRFGSAALDLCYVAAGRFDGFWEIGLKPWDMAAGVAILLEAGGKVSSLEGGTYVLSSGDILASNGRVHDELIRLM